MSRFEPLKRLYYKGDMGHNRCASTYAFTCFADI